VPDVRVFPSALPQSEIHISINKQNPQVLLLSGQAFPVAPNNSWQGAYWSTNGGMNWVGADDLPNNLSGRGDPSTAFDAAGNGYVATMARAATSTDFNDPPCQKFYTGHTQNLDNRLLEHNAGETKAIKSCTPWKLVWQQEVASYAT
jgi:hypothetical protein